MKKKTTQKTCALLIVKNPSLLCPV